MATFPGTRDSEDLSLLLSQIIVKKVSKQHRWYLENTSCDRESCWKEKILLSARGFSVFFQMLVKAQKVGKNLSSWPPAVFRISDHGNMLRLLTKMRCLEIEAVRSC